MKRYWRFFAFLIFLAAAYWFGYSSGSQKLVHRSIASTGSALDAELVTGWTGESPVVYRMVDPKNHVVCYFAKSDPNGNFNLNCVSLK